MHNTTEIENETGMSLLTGAHPYINEDLEEGRLSSIAKYIDGYLSKLKLHYEKQSRFEAFAIESIKENEKIQIGEVGKWVKWVKASERMPNNNGVFIIKSFAYYHYPLSAKFENGTFYDTDYENQNDENSIRQRINHLKDLEWLDESATDKPEELQEKQEEGFVARMISELPEYGINTSKWEYDYGDCCYGGAMEFISRIIKGASEPPEELQEEVERLRAALENISIMQIIRPSEAEGRFYDCIDIAEQSLNGNSKNNEPMKDVDGWIKVAQQLPEKQMDEWSFSKDVSVKCCGKELIAYYHHTNKKWYKVDAEQNYSELSGVTHWRPISAS